MSATFFPLHGVYAAVLTPMKDDLSADHETMARHCRWLLANGCDGLSVLGTTGEANSFSAGERLEILENLAEAGIPATALLPGTGCCAAADTIALSRRAVELGAPGVLMLPPFYYKNVSDDGLFAAFSDVIEAVGDTRLKVYLYHFPQLSGVPLSLALIERLLKRYPKTVCGMKDSSGDLSNMTAAAREFPGFTVFSGSERTFLPLLKDGGAGCITAGCNIASPAAARLYGGWREGGDVEDAERELLAARAAIAEFPLSAALKTVMARHAQKPSWLNIRPPLTRLSGQQADALFAALDGAGVTLAALP